MAVKVQLLGMVFHKKSSFLRMLGLVFGCACGMTGNDGFPVEKVWMLCSSSTLLIDCMAEFKCTEDHSHSRDFVLKDTQYDPAFARRALMALSAW